MSLPRASLNALTAVVRATMSSLSTKWLSVLPSEEMEARERERGVEVTASVWVEKGTPAVVIATPTLPPLPPAGPRNK